MLGDVVLESKRLKCFKTTIDVSNQQLAENFWLLLLKCVKVNKEPKQLEFELTFSHRTDWKFCGAMTKNEFPDVKEFPCDSFKGTVFQMILDVSEKHKNHAELFNNPPDWSYFPVVPTVVKFRVQCFELQTLQSVFVCFLTINKLNFVKCDYNTRYKTRKQQFTKYKPITSFCRWWHDPDRWRSYDFSCGFLKGLRCEIFDVNLDLTRGFTWEKARPACDKIALRQTVEFLYKQPGCYRLPAKLVIFSHSFEQLERLANTVNHENAVFVINSRDDLSPASTGQGESAYDRILPVIKALKKSKVKKLVYWPISGPKGISCRNEPLTPIKFDCNELLEQNFTEAFSANDTVAQRNFHREGQYTSESDSDESGDDEVDEV